MQWFQYKPGVAVESLRVVHRAATADPLNPVSWCGRCFRFEDIEPVADPSATAEVPAGAPCLPCLLLVAAAAEPPRAIETHTGASVDNRTLAGALRKAQWMLDDAAHYIPEGRCSAEDCTLLAETLDQVAALMREQAARMVADQ